MSKQTCRNSIEGMWMLLQNSNLTWQMDNHCCPLQITFNYLLDGRVSCHISEYFTYMKAASILAGQWHTMKWRMPYHPKLHYLFPDLDPSLWLLHLHCSVQKKNYTCSLKMFCYFMHPLRETGELSIVSVASPPPTPAQHLFHSCIPNGQKH